MGLCRRRAEACAVDGTAGGVDELDFERDEPFARAGFEGGMELAGDLIEAADGVVADGRETERAMPIAGGGVEDDTCGDQIAPRQRIRDRAGGLHDRVFIGVCGLVDGRVGHRGKVCEGWRPGDAISSRDER